jgi:hypothetical protein
MIAKTRLPQYSWISSENREYGINQQSNHEVLRHSIATIKIQPHERRDYWNLGNYANSFREKRPRDSTYGQIREGRPFSPPQQQLFVHLDMLHRPIVGFRIILHTLRLWWSESATAAFPQWSLLTRRNGKSPDKISDKIDIFQINSLNCNKRLKTNFFSYVYLDLSFPYQTWHPAVCILINRVHPIFVDYFVFGD